MAWNFDAHRPIFAQIAERLTEDILCGRYPPGGRLPSVRELAVEAAVNPNTVQRALVALESAGLAATNRGAGRCVTEDKAVIAAARRTQAAGLTRTYLQRMAALGFDRTAAAQLLSEIETGGENQ